MKLRFRVPFGVTIWSDHEDASLDLAAEFADEPCLKVSCRMEGDGDKQFLEDSDQRSWTRQITALAFEVDQPDPAPDLATLLADPEALRARLTGMINRVLRAIRNTGLTPYVHEVRPQINAKEQLELWETERQIPGEQWAPVVEAPQRDLVELMVFRSKLTPTTSGGPSPWLKAAFWPAIREAIHDNLAPQPEDEFVTNSLEHLNLGNQRLALMEAVIGLEIVLTKYLSKYLEQSRGWSNNRIKDVLRPELGLSLRVQLLLPLIMGQREAKLVDWDDVTIAIRWRNSLVHTTGHLPEVPPSEVDRRIRAVLFLARMLAQLAYELSEEPAIRDIAVAAAKEYDMPAPAIHVFDKHRVLVQFQLPIFETIPDVAALNTVVASMADELGKHFGHFDSERDLHVTFSQLAELNYIWTRGELQTLKEPMPPLPVSPGGGPNAT